MVETSEARWWCAELQRLRAVFLTAMGADETEIEVSFCEAIRIAKEQKSTSLAKRAEATYAEYRRQKAERVRWDVDSDYLFVDAKREIPKSQTMTLRIIWHKVLRAILAYTRDAAMGRNKHLIASSRGHA